MPPILMYHALWPDVESAALEAHCAADPQLRDPGARRYGLSIQQFAVHLAAIRQAGWLTVKQWDELRKIPEPTRKILLTFDDGHISNFELALPALQAQRFHAGFFITTDWISRPGFMNETQLRNMREAGMALGTHGCSHRYFSDLSETELQRELVDSKKKLENILGEPIVALALPGGRGHPRLRALAHEAGYEFIFTSRIGIAKPAHELDDLPRIPIINTQPHEFLDRLLQGDFSAIEKMARKARTRDALKRILGNRLYDRVRGILLRA